MIETLKIGARGPSVALLQTALQRAGAFTGTADGIFGEQTRQAVMRFQSRNGLTPDGIAGPKTQEALMPYMVGFRRHTVMRGDTFYRVAKRYGTTVQAVASANPAVHPNRLQIGQILVIPLGFPVVPANIPLSSEIMALYIQGLAARYPFLRTGSIGASVMGRQIPFIAIGTGATEIFYNGAHHANEWITALLLLRLCESYADAVAAGRNFYGQNAAAMAAQTTLYVVPMVNPDGVDLVTGALTGGSYYERAVAIANDYPQIPFPDGWKANISGVDPNLSYPAEWERAREIKFAQGYTTPAPRDYVGSAPLEAPESRAVYDFTRMRNFQLSISWHTQGEVIYWQFLNIRPPRAEAIGTALAASSGYELAETPYESSFAGFKDWFLQQFNRPGYTVEAGQGENPLPLTQFPKIYADNLGIFALGMRLGG